MKGIRIPEGNAAAVAVGGVNVWNAGGWDVEWEYDSIISELPDTSIWEYPVGTGVVRYQSYGFDDDGLMLESQYSGYDYAMFRPRDYLARMGKKAILEVDFVAIDTVSGTNGFRLILGEGDSGAASGRGLQCAFRYNYVYPVPAVPDSYLHVMYADAALTVDTDSAYVEPDTLHTVRMELDTVTGVNKIKLDGELIATLANDQLSTTYADKICCMSQKGDIPIRAFRYRALL